MLYNGYSCTKMPFILFILFVVQIQQYKIESVFIKLTNAFNINYERLISLKMLRNIFSLGLSLSIFGGASYGYIFYKTKKNKAQYQLTLQSDTLKDASRLTNDSFGISWGFQADDTIMKRIDSGDLFFVKFDCQECLSVEQFVNCHFYTMFLLDQQFHTVGMGYRTQAGLQIIYNEFGTTLKRSYTDFVGLPYLKQLSIQRTDHQQYPTIHQQLSDLVLKEPQSIFKKQSPINFINNLSNKLKMEYTKYGNRIRNLRQLIITQEMINVRTQTNRALRSL